MLYPNPAREKITLQFFTTEKLNASLFITDMAGRHLLARELKGAEGASLISLDIASLSAGAYRAVLYQPLKAPSVNGFIKQ